MDRVTTILKVLWAIMWVGVLRPVSAVLLVLLGGPILLILWLTVGTDDEIQDYIHRNDRGYRRKT